MSLYSQSASFESSSDVIPVSKSPPRTLQFIHKELIEIKKANYNLEQRCLAAEYLNTQLHEKINYLEMINSDLSHKLADPEKELQLQSSLDKCNKLIENNRALADRNAELAQSAHEAVDRQRELSHAVKKQGRIIEKRELEIESLKASQELLDGELNESKEQLQQICNKYETVLEQNAFLSSQLERVETANKELKKLLQSTEMRHESKISQKMSEMSSELSKARADLELLKKKYSKAKVSSKELRETSHQLEQSEQKRKSLNEMIQSMNQHEAEHQKEVADLKLENSELIASLDEVQTSLEQAETELAERGRIIGRMRTRIDDLEEGRRTRAKQSEQDLKRKLRASEEKVKGLEDVISQYKENEKQYTMSMQRAAAQLDEKIVEIENLKTQIWKHRKTEKEKEAVSLALDNARAEMQRMETNQKHLETENARLHKSAEESNQPLLEQINILSNQIELTRQEQAKLESTKDSLKQEIVNLKEENMRLQDLRRQNAVLSEKLENVKNQCAVENQRVRAECDASVREVNKSFEELRNQIELGRQQRNAQQVEIREYQRTIENLERVIETQGSSIHESKKLAEKCERLENDLLQSELAVRTSSTELQRVVSILASKDAEIETYSSRISELESDSLRKCDSLNEQINQLQRNNQQLLRNQENLESEKENIAATRKELETKLKQMASDHDAEINTFEARVRQLTAEINNLQAKTEKVEKENVSLKDQLSGQKLINQELKNSNDEIKEYVNKYCKLLGINESDSVAHEIQAIADATKQLLQEKESIRESLKTRTTESVTPLINQISSLIEENDSLIEEISLAKQLIIEQMKTSEHKVAEDAPLVNHVQGLVDENEKLFDEITNLNFDNTRLKKGAQLRPQLQSIVDENDQLEKENQNMKWEVQKLQQKVHQLEDQIDTMNVQRDALLASMRQDDDFGSSEDEGSVAYKVNHIQRLMEKNTQLRQKNEEILNHLNTIYQEHEESQRQMEELEDKNAELAEKIREALNDKEEEETERVSHIQLLLNENEDVKEQNESLKKKLEEKEKL